MTNDRRISIALGGSYRSKHWQNTTMLLSEVYTRLGNPVRSATTGLEYDGLTKAQKTELKDVGGFVGGSLKDGRRKASNVLQRDLITLDADNIPSGETDRWTKRVDSLGLSYAVYSTHSHRVDSPRLRFVIPLVRPVTPDEYCFLSRKMAWAIDERLQIFDPTTFQPERLMFWPSVDSDMPFVYACRDAPMLDPAPWLAEDWQDMCRWPQVPGHELDAAPLKAIGRLKQSPEDAIGIVGVFNRAFSILDAMDQFLPGTYEEFPGAGDRYTYTGGHSAGGAVVYEGKFLYSHHATDPAGGVLCNAFDLVRLHRYADLDAEVSPKTPINKRPSYLEMRQYIKSLPAIKAALDREKAAEMDGVFSELYGKLPLEGGQKPVEGGAAAITSNTPSDNQGPQNGSESAPDGLPQITSPSELLPHLEKDDKGNLTPCVKNYKLVLMHDPALKGCLWQNIFTGNPMCERMPGRSSRAPLPFVFKADAGPLTIHIQSVYGMQVNLRFLELAVNEVLLEVRRHPVREWMDPLVWDGVERLDRLTVGLFGCADTPYTRAVTRKFICAIVKRVYQPGAKFDVMLVLDGEQGSGKSTFAKTLAIREIWHVDNISSFYGKDAYELLSGRLIVEAAEMAAFSKTDARHMKNFITQTSYRFRPAYAPKVLDLPTQCVLIGTTNVKEFLNDPTGNRRYWVLPTTTKTFRREAFAAFAHDIAQIYAEAKYRLFEENESLELSPALKAELRTLQESDYTDYSTWYYEIAGFLQMPVPPIWHGMRHQEKSVYLANTAAFEEEAQRQQILGETYRMQYTTIREVFEFVIRRQPGGEHLAYDRRTQLDIATAMRECKWEKRTARRDGKLGKYWFPKE